jgi:queuine tRNA-ribosyltransferase
MGVGHPVDIIVCIALGVDMFDCVLPTRLARHGTILTSSGRMNLRNARFADDPDPLEPGCTCEACSRWSRAYLRHLLMVSEPTAARLTTIHNVHWLLRLMEAAQAAIVAGTYDQFRVSVASVWD